MPITDTKALEKLAERIKNCPPEVNNSSLHAGSPMYFYCRICGHQSDVLPESYSGSPAKYCGLCKELKGANPGLTDATIKEEAASCGSKTTLHPATSKKSAPATTSKSGPVGKRSRRTPRKGRSTHRAIGR